MVKALYSAEERAEQAEIAAYAASRCDAERENDERDRAEAEAREGRDFEILWDEEETYGS